MLDTMVLEDIDVVCGKGAIQRIKHCVLHVYNVHRITFKCTIGLCLFSTDTTICISSTIYGLNLWNLKSLCHGIPFYLPLIKRIATGEFSLYPRKNNCNTSVLYLKCSRIDNCYVKFLLQCTLEIKLN